jgi:hypothetical protein
MSRTLESWGRSTWNVNRPNHNVTGEDGCHGISIGVGSSSLSFEDADSSKNAGDGVHIGAGGASGIPGHNIDFHQKTKDALGAIDSTQGDLLLRLPSA